jgi:DNA-binding FadR family transcriptional regulator
MASTDPTSPESISADVAFHKAILAGTGNDFIAAFTPVMSAALNVTFRIQRDAAALGREHFVPSHREILDAIVCGDPEAARAAYLALLNTAEDDAMKGIREHGGED